MASVTVVETLEAYPGEENVRLAITDGYTYVSKLSDVMGAQVTYEDEIHSVGGTGGTAIAKLPGYSVSGRTITFTTGEDTDGVTCHGGTAFVTIKGSV